MYRDIWTVTQLCAVKALAVVTGDSAGDESLFLLQVF